ncbi:hypothetical protein [Cellulosimicrobium sp. I38E]|uniref:hypothetical protein n=1 Tax=Cellulosimicrobium sp. I38E TaxID=1393139 RepID=UPI0007B30292|nr:hypothetical protein [Cellulosimicrobium sp. I38E]KZM76736.1 hypothetical protein A0J59_04815 [Cellulosimicrobium sp. I38E]
MTRRARWLVAAASALSALLALALTGGGLDGDLAGLAWYYGLMFPWASLGTTLVMLALIDLPATHPLLPALELVVVLLAGATQGAVVAGVALLGRAWCARRRSLRAVRAGSDAHVALMRVRPSGIT